jgi:hypothetical protein
MLSHLNLFVWICLFIVSYIIFCFDFSFFLVLNDLIFHLIMMFPACYGIRNFVTLFTGVRNLNLSKPVESSLQHVCLWLIPWSQRPSSFLFSGGFTIIYSYQHSHSCYVIFLTNSFQREVHIMKLPVLSIKPFAFRWSRCASQDFVPQKTLISDLPLA